MFFIFCVWSLCLDICGRTVKLSFLSCGFKGVRQTTAGNTHCWGVVRAAVIGDVCYDVTLCFSFPSVGNRLFSFCLMLDNDCWAMEIIWRNLETDKRNSKRSENSRF